MNCSRLLLSALVFGLASLIESCATSPTVPAAPAQSVMVSEIGGLKISVDSTAWKSDEYHDRDDGILSVWVSIERAEGTSFAYRDLALVGRSGARFIALPAAALKRVGATVRMVGVRSFPTDPVSSGVTYLPQEKQYDYETSDLVRKALRLSPDGRGQGFVYFDAAARRETGVWFELTVVNKSTGENLGRLTLPVGVRELEGDPKKSAPLKKQPIERRPAGIQ